MKKVIFLLIISFTCITGKAQLSEHLSFATTIGTGFAISKPGSVPFEWQILGYYQISKRLSVGAGSGISVYEKILIPLFADAKFTIIKPSRFTPYLECGIGYSFAPNKHANGGFYLHPSVGIQYSIFKDKKVFLALGYELQKLERLKKNKQPLFTAEFAEKLNHQTTYIKIGFIF